MPIVLAAPVGGQPVRVPPASRMPRRMTWTGFDGSVWSLTRPAAVNPRMLPGVRGLHMPQFDAFTSSTPLAHGEDVDGYWIPPRDVYWPMLFRSASVEEWEFTHAGFFASFHPVRTGLWTVGEGVAARSLPLRGAFRGDHVFDFDPFVHGRAVIGVELSAPRPLWRGAPIRKVFKPGSGQPFIPEGGGPPFYVSPANRFATARIDNPGPEPVWLDWEVDGPQESVVLGIGDALITVPFDVPAGKRLAISTDPTREYAALGDIPEPDQPFAGDDVSATLGFQLFAPVPARGSTPLTIQGLGTGAIAVELTPLHWTAF